MTLVGTRKQAWQQILRIFQARLDRTTKTVQQRDITSAGLCYAVYLTDVSYGHQLTMLKDVTNVRPAKISGLYYWPTWDWSSTRKDRDLGLRCRIKAIKTILRNIRKEERQ